MLISKMDAEISEIFEDFSREKPRKIPPIYFNRLENSDISVSVGNF